MTIHNNNIQQLLAQYLATRQTTIDICKPLQNEDFVVQPVAEVSPPKWHLAHTTWFFEEFILCQFQKNYVRFNLQYSKLFNSYYKSVGIHTAQQNRGNLSRPTVNQIYEYRANIDAQIIKLISDYALCDEAEFLLETGIHHEQQHQELLFMDIKYILSSNEVATCYSTVELNQAHAPQSGWKTFGEGLYEIGHDGDNFSYDNEQPRHKNYQYAFSVCESVVTNGEFLAFMQDNAYCKAQYWLSDGWNWVNQYQIKCPLYWSCVDGEWYEYTLHGLLPLDLNNPLVHISYFEADAFANWKNLRLPTESELEIYLSSTQNMHCDPILNTISSPKIYHPNAANALTPQVWCWTRSQYSPYPKYKAFDGALNEYNGKFMCNQFVLRGGCIVTPDNHYRHSYRNFYQTQQRWMFSGIRLAKDII
ncbi:MAG: sulfatase maturase [Proteobacteria bacterium ST_bin12]|nr:MAG: sulfatase maturase [Proteobacteria bacterium ST_bin12]